MIENATTEQARTTDVVAPVFACAGMSVRSSALRAFPVSTGVVSLVIAATPAQVDGTRVRGYARVLGTADHMLPGPPVWRPPV